MKTRVYGGLEGPFHSWQLSARSGHLLLRGRAHSTAPAKPLPDSQSMDFHILFVALGTQLPLCPPSGLLRAGRYWHKRTRHGVRCNIPIWLQKPLQQGKLSSGEVCGPEEPIWANRKPFRVGNSGRELKASLPQ